MGMTDAAIDFKQAVNHRKGKNLLGAYYPASTIVIDTECLQTLSDRHILNGIAEALKHALAQSRSMTEMIVTPLRETNLACLRDPEYLDMVCRTCIDHKVPTLIYYTQSNFNEMVPQYGHAIAHALEHLSFHCGDSVKPLLHGEAVAIGMCVSAEVAFILGICDEQTVSEHYEFISDSGLPTFVPRNMTLKDIMAKLRYDKHYVKKPAMGLLSKIGFMYSKDGDYAQTIPHEVTLKALSANIERRDAAPFSYAPPESELPISDIVNVVMASNAEELTNHAESVFEDGNLLDEWRAVSVDSSEFNARKENIYWRLWAMKGNH
uniref:3-dehydroquinate synthase domain-containing protein n=1 Tax=Stereomyxa ramosa TaxID=1078864 RepID=A0A7S2EXT9_9EUKA|mmetsp:Transcript_1192/g.1451  ORF Transcript_1192/g.1451 Transcript_1192/m.1451 type:complete len:321 (+) Transcript_1192:3-965(+)